ncbi:MAG TPA: hypothetical protein VN372_10500 [Methanospirillum sp.]|nr:hypothetical protein [Methanospirillum sp.]
MNIPKEETRVPYPLPGPGLLVVLSSSGWIGLLSLISFGADSGYAFVGITLFTLIFKFSLITGLGRYTLATGTDIFAGIATIPGPKNWGVWMINAILYAEIFMLGFSALTMTRLINELLGVKFPPTLVIILLFILIFILVSINSYWFFRKILIAAISLILIGFTLMIISMPLAIHEILGGLVPNMSMYVSVYESSIILSSVGSGFSLLFYSVWLLNHLNGRVLPEEKENILHRIRMDAGMGISFLFLLCILYFSIGFIFLYEHGLGAPESDLTLEIVLTVMNLGLAGNLIFVMICMLALFCSLLGGIYGRAKVLQVTLPRTVQGLQISRRAFILVVLCLSLSAICAQFFWTQEMARDFISIRLVLFSIVTGILMLADWKLRPGDRGSATWYIIMAAGSLCSLLIGLNLISRYFE